MARITRRHAFHMTSASVLAAALALPAGIAAAAPVPEVHSASGTDAPVQTPPPSPTAPPPSTPSAPSAATTPPPSASSGVPTPTGTTPNETSPTEEASTEEAPGTGESDTSASGVPVDQKQELDDATADLDEKKEEVPEGLVPSVTQLTSVLEAVDDPQVSPQVRGGVTTTAQEVASALDVIVDAGTPREVRGQLTKVVKQVVSTLEAANQPGVPPEKRSAITLIVERSASVLRMVGDTGTPQQLRGRLRKIVNDLTSTLTRSLAAGTPDAATVRDASWIGASLAVLRDPKTPDKKRKGLAKTTQEAGSSLETSGDPNASDEERAEAKEKLEKQTDRMKKEQEDAASAQGLPDVPLGEAAEACTNTIFDSVPDRTLTRDLKSLIPEEWDTEGVKDFWKSKETGDDVLDVLAQLRNDEFDDTPLGIAQLIPQLAHSVPASKLFETLGTPALHCLQSALLLDQDRGVSSGTWVKMAEEKA